MQEQEASLSFGTKCLCSSYGCLYNRGLIFGSPCVSHLTAKFQDKWNFAFAKKESKTFTLDLIFLSDISFKSKVARSPIQLWDWWCYAGISYLKNIAAHGLTHDTCKRIRLAPLLCLRSNFRLWAREEQESITFYRTCPLDHGLCTEIASKDCPLWQVKSHMNMHAPLLHFS